MRRRPTDLFAEAKKRFQFRPVSSRKPHLNDILRTKTPDGSHVKRKPKENRSNNSSGIKDKTGRWERGGDKEKGMLSKSGDSLFESTRKSFDNSKSLTRVLKEISTNEKCVSRVSGKYNLKHQNPRRTQAPSLSNQNSYHLSSRPRGVQKWEVQH